MKLLKSVILFIIMSISLLAAKEDYFASVDWLKENIDNENIIILDARDSNISYIKGHIPGAVLTSWTDFSNMEDSPSTNREWGSLTDIESIETELQNLGLNTDSEVIIYNNTLNGFGEGARLLWMLKYVGFENVKLLDGGIEAWINEDGNLDNFGRSNEPGNFTIGELNKDIIISTQELSDNFDDYSILDTRDGEEYVGIRNYGESKNGRIPGSHHIYYTNFIDTDSLLRPETEIENIISGSGIDTSKPVVVYCSGGIRSSLVWLIMSAYGYEVLNYDSSFTGWTYDDLPVE